MSTVLEIRGLTVVFGGVSALNDVSFDLRKGEILGVVGPNGAGKTTMFDAISGFVPARGRVLLGGRDIGDAAPEVRSRAGLGRSFQDARLFPSLTVAETLAVAYERHIRAQDVVSTALRLPWVRRAEKRIAAKVEELIELMGLGAFRDKFVSELSTGSRRIVDLAVIMAHDPKVLLLDEPSSGIAQRETEALGPLLLRLRNETGASLIVVEHDMPLIQTVSDELLALETGRVLTRGEPKEVLDDPRLVAAYLGTDQAVIARSGAATTSSNGSAGTGSTRRARPRRTPPTTSTSQATPAGRMVPKKAAAKKAAPKRPAAATAADPKAPRGSASAAASQKAAATKKAVAKKTVAKKTTAKKATARSTGAGDAPGTNG